MLDVFFERTQERSIILALWDTFLFWQCFGFSVPGWKNPHGLTLLVSSRFVPSDIHCVAPFVCLPNDHPAVPPSVSSRFIPSSCAPFLFLSYRLLFCRLVSGCRVRLHKKKKNKFHSFVPTWSHHSKYSLLFFFFGHGVGEVVESEKQIAKKKKEKKSCLLYTQANDHETNFLLQLSNSQYLLHAAWRPAWPSSLRSRRR